MNTTAKLFATALTFGFVTTNSPVLAATQSLTLQVVLGTASLGQTGASSQKEADELLASARKAMSEGKLELADSYLSRAEKLNPQYKMFHMGDTPKKLRDDLQKKQAAVKSDRATSPTGGAGNSLFGKKEPPKDPFAARRSESPANAAPSGNSLAVNNAAINTTLTNSTQSNAVTTNSGNNQGNNNSVPGPAYGASTTTPSSAYGANNATSGSVYGNLSASAYGPGAANAGANGNAPASSNTANNGAANPARWPASEATVKPAVNPIRSTISASQGNAMNQIVPLAGSNNGAAVTSAPNMLPSKAGNQPVRSIYEEPMAGIPQSNHKQQAVDLARQARAALVRGDLNAAEQLVRQAQGLAQDSDFGPADERPSVVMFDIQRARAANRGNTVAQAGGAGAAELAVRTGAVRSASNTANDTTHNVPANNNVAIRPTWEQLATAAPNAEPIAAPPGALNNNSVSPAQATETVTRPPANATGPNATGPNTPGAGGNANAATRLFQQGEQALAEKNAPKALDYFRQAYAMQNDLEPALRNRLLTHMQMLSRPQGPARDPRTGNLLEGVANNQQVISKQVASDVSRTQTAAKQLLAKEPKRALESLQRMRDTVASATLEGTEREHQLRRLDASIKETQQYITQNAAQIELDEQNNAVRADFDREQKNKLATDDKLARLVDDFNRLVDEQRYAEAEQLAKKARAMDANNPVVVQLVHTSKVLHRLNIQKGIAEQKEEFFVDVMTDVDRAAGGFKYSDYEFPNARSWGDLSKRRLEREATGNSRHSNIERQIDQKLKSVTVLLKYDRRPLGEVVADLGRLSGINIWLDPQGLAAEGVTSDTPISINLSSEIMLKSALTLILEPLRMSYIVSNDVLKITSSEMTNGKVYTKSYQVADLVIPIPNFVPNGGGGINDALREGYNRANYGIPGGGFGGGSPSVILADSRPGVPGNAAVNAQMINNVGSGGPPATGVQQPMGFGPGGLGGGAQADFDSLIELITTTIAPTTWDTVGGPGAVSPFETNLTLVVSQTQEVHEQIADLLQQLRRLQDLQVTIEVRFITLNDSFFERIGLDFDFNIDDNVGGPAQINSDSGPSQVVGLDPLGVPTANLNLQFTQGSFVSGTVPSFPGIGFDPATAGRFGFAILSDIEAFFLIEAAQGDTRSNILQAPKVTLFNGQQAFISDTSQRPFVTSIIPVVGDFAAAQQPVIVVLSEGTSLTVQAVVSSDRRFVRLTVVPFFSQIGDVEEFTFTGSKTTTTKSSDSKSGTTDTAASKDATTTEEGTTVQLPTFSFVTVTTTVSVPDGGTVLLGGIKRLSEGRNERGIPILSKIPYISRLFRNVGIGRTTSSLMLMVTPRIIIQEEEEEKLIGSPAP